MSLRCHTHHPVKFLKLTHIREQVALARIGALSAATRLHAVGQIGGSIFQFWMVLTLSANGVDARLHLDIVKGISTQGGIGHRVLNVCVSHVLLDLTQVVTGIDEMDTAGMA